MSAIATSTLAAVFAVCTAQPMVSAPLVSGPLRIDGIPTDPAWSSAQELAPFCLLGNKGVAPLQPRVMVCRDGQKLYVGGWVPKPEGLLPKATVFDRDGNVWQDDAVEVFVAPSGPTGPYYQFIVNAAGVVWDSAGKDGSWDARWDARARSAAPGNFWTFELAIPFSALGRVPRPGEEWGFNVAWDCQKPGPFHATWAPVQTTFHEPEHFGVLVMADSAPSVRDVSVAVRPLQGEIQFAAKVAARRAPVELSMSFGQSGSMRRVGRKTLAAGTALHWRAAASLPKARGPRKTHGQFTALVTASAAGKPVYRAVIPMVVAPPIDIQMRKFLLRAKKVLVQANASVLASKRPVAELRASLVDGVGRAVTSAAGKPDEKTTASLWLDLADVAPGDYKLVVAAVGKSGETLHEVSQDLRVPKPPQWLGNKEGITDKVLPPWTPLRTEEASVLPWGREYRWGALPFPEQVSTRGAEVLAAPMRLLAVVNGQQQAWMGGRPQFTLRTPARVELTTTAAGQGARLTGKIWVEYDGCVRCDWQLTPTRPGAELQRLVFEIPFKAQYARYIYHFPGRWRSAFNAGAVPEKGLTMGFRPFVWLGDEWRGLAWFCPSDEAFRPANPQEVTEIEPRGDVVALRINLIEEPVSLAEPLRVTFGFEATPVRPNPQDVWDYRIVHSGNYGLEERRWSPPREIRWPAEGNIDVRHGTLEAWVRPHFDPEVPVKPGDPSRGRYNRNFFLFSFGRYTVGYYWNIDDRGMRLYVRTPDGKYPIVFGARNRWKKGEWHHIAVSWGEEVRLYEDGKLLAKRPYKGLLPVVPTDLKGGYLSLGSGTCEMDVDELCISNVQREPRGHTGPLQPDEHTLLLENFDRIDRSPMAVTTVPLAAAGGRGQVMSSSLELVDGRFGRAAAFFVPTGKAPLMLDRYKELGVRTICFHEHWSRIQNYFAPANPEGLHKLVRACHARGIRLLVYYGYELSNIAPEWDVYKDEVLIYPRGGGYHRQPEQRCYICCYKSAWQDYLAWAIAKTMDEFDMDGVYLDGTANPFGCANLGHGCGYIGRDGKLHRTYPFFEVRQMMKRIYTIVKTRKPNGLVNVHQSTCMTIPSVGWATSYWDGEQFGSIPRGPENWPLDILPLDAFRAEFMGHNWGVPAELLCYQRPYTFAEALAITLPHDVLVRPGDVELASRIWKAAEAFGRHQAKWLPYWQNTDYVKVNDDDVKCSIYSRGSKGILFVVSNLGKSEVGARLWFNLRALGLPRQVECYDMLDGQRLDCEKGRLALEMGPLQFRLLWMGPAEERPAVTAAKQ